MEEQYSINLVPDQKIKGLYTIKHYDLEGKEISFHEAMKDFNSLEILKEAFELYINKNRFKSRIFNKKNRSLESSI